MQLLKDILLPAACCLALWSCSLEDPYDCCYNVSLEYRYQRYGALGKNELGFYVSTLREYIFNERDTLVAVNDYKVPHGNGDFFSEQNFPPGRYTVITLGNKTGLEQIRKEEIGSTTRQEILLWMNNPQELQKTFDSKEQIYTDPNIQGHSDRLYYGYRTFTVEEYGVTRIAVDMTHAHCVLGFTVQWIDNTGRPKAGETYTVTMKQIPSLYQLMPDKMVYNTIETDVFAPDKEVWPHRDFRRINYIPTVSRVNQANHAIRGSVSGNVLYGEFITLRYRSDSHELMSICSSTERVMKEIDLHEFFQQMGINLDYSLCQEYNLVIEIDGDQVRVGLMSVDDWEDGGML